MTLHTEEEYIDSSFEIDLSNYESVVKNLGQIEKTLRLEYTSL